MTYKFISLFAGRRLYKFCDASPFVFLVTPLAGGKQITVGLYRINNGVIKWSGYDTIVWEGKCRLELNWCSVLFNITTA